MHTDLDARPWDFQAEECALRSAVDRFNSRRYDKNSSGYAVRTLLLFSHVHNNTFDIYISGRIRNMSRSITG